MTAALTDANPIGTAVRALHHAEPSVPRSHFRRDIQGLRAVAVVLVIFDHLLRWPSGGFIGVDVFFVISGFLITSHLLREHEREGRVSLAGFYRRRVKRLAPVALVVVAVVLIVAHSLFSSARFANMLADAFWAILFGENWRQIAVGTDYLHAGTAVSPFQHYWSLSVEEQFYFVWPLLLLAVLAVGRVRSKRMRAGVVLGLLTVISVAWGAYESAHQPTWAYFSLFSRTWELGAGAVLACAAPWATKLGTAARPVIAWAGLAMIGGSALLLNSSSAFPVPGAIPAVVGAVAVIGAGIGGPSRYLWPLTSRPLNYLGTISYSLYLWHFPVVVFWAAVFPSTSRKYLAPALLLMLVLAALSYHWIESPLRRRSWTRPFLNDRVRPTRAALVGLAVSLALVIAIPSVSLALRHPATASSVPVADLISTTAQGPAASLRSQQTAEAIDAKSWPHLTPALDGLDASYKAPEWIKGGCLGEESGALPDPVANAERCVFGGSQASRTVDIFGDSTAISYAQAIRGAMPAWRVEIWTLQQCPAVDVAVHLADGAVDPQCARFRAAFYDHVAKTHPELVAITSTVTAVQNLASRAAGAQAQTEWRAGTEQLLKAVAPNVGHVVLLDPPPLGPHLDECGMVLSSPSDCLGGVRDSYTTEVRAQREAVDTFKGANVNYPSTLTWFCSARGICPAFVNDVITLDDGVHLTAAGSRALAPLLKEALRTELGERQ